MIVDLFLIEEFISASTKKSTRSMYLNVLKASIDFLLDMQINENETNEESDYVTAELEPHSKLPSELVTAESPGPGTDRFDPVSLKLNLTKLQEAQTPDTRTLTNTLANSQMSEKYQARTPNNDLKKNKKRTKILVSRTPIQYKENKSLRVSESGPTQQSDLDYHDYEDV